MIDAILKYSDKTTAERSLTDAELMEEHEVPVYEKREFPAEDAAVEDAWDAIISAQKAVDELKEVTK